MSVLVLSQTDAAAKRIARFLSGGTAKAAPNRDVPVHSFRRGDLAYHVVGLPGDLTEVDYAPELREWRGTDLQELVQAEPEAILRRDRQALVETLESLAAEAEKVVIATDPTAEGERLGVEAAAVVRAVRAVPIVRARLTSLTKRAVEEAFEAAAGVDAALAAGAEARRRIDLAWRAVLTRYVTLRGHARHGEYLLLDRIATPVLARLVRRENEIADFEPKAYWQVTVAITGPSVFRADHSSSPFHDPAAARRAESAAGAATEATVVRVETEPVAEPAPRPFDTAAFQEEASRKLGMEVPHAVQVAERLYIGGAISFPITDSTSFPAGTDFDATLRMIAKMPEYAQVAKDWMRMQDEPARPGTDPAGGVPPIHPVEPLRKSDVPKEEWDVYDLIVRRFLAATAPEARGEAQSVWLEIGSETFQAAGYRGLEEGWRAFYPFTSSRGRDALDVKVGDKLAVSGVERVEKSTQSPARYTQADLLGLLDDMGLGTSSTRHDVIAHLASRTYVKGGTTFEPTERVAAVMEALDRFAPIVTRPEPAAGIEAQLAAVVQGRAEATAAVDESRRRLEEVLAVLVQNEEDLSVALQGALKMQARVGPCPTCGKDLLIRRARQSGNRFIGCSGWPDCKQTYPLPQDGLIEPQGTACAACGAPEMRLLKRARRTWEFCANIDCPRREERRAEAEQPTAASATGAGKAAGAGRRGS